MNTRVDLDFPFKLKCEFHIGSSHGLMSLIRRLAEVPADSHRSSQHPYCSSGTFPETYYSVKGTPCSV